MLGRDGDGGPGEHHVGHYGSADAARHLDGQVGGGLSPRQTAESGIDEGDHRVVMATRDRPEHQDDGEEPGGGGRGVLEELQAGVSRRQILCGDARADDNRGEERAPQQFGQEPAPQGRTMGIGSLRRALSLSSRTTGRGSRPLAPALFGRRRRRSTTRRPQCRPVGVGQDGVDLPRRTVRAVDPHLVLDRVAACRVVLVLVASPSAARRPSLVTSSGRVHLDAEMVEGAGDASPRGGPRSGRA